MPAGPPDKGHGKTGSGQGSTDPDHSLVIVQVIGHREKDPLFHGAKVPIPPDIIHLGSGNPVFYGIFGLDFNKFEKMS